MFSQFLFVFVLSAVLGSYLNVVIYRRSFKYSLFGRSKCTSCKKVLTARELIPIFSYLIQKGRFFGCKQKISIRYIVVEMLTIISTMLIFVFLGFSFYSLLLSLSLLFVIPLTVFDILELEFPSFLLYPFMFFSFLYSVYSSIHLFSLYPLIAPFAFASLFLVLFILTNKKGIGFGDVILAFSLGGLIGFDIYKIFFAFVGSFWIGTLVCGFILIYQKMNNKKLLHRKQAIPFGPFIILSTFITILLL